MTHTVRTFMLGGSALLIAACAERISGAGDSDLLDAAFISAPLGFESTASSFTTANGTLGAAFLPAGSGRRDGRGPSGLPGGHAFMGGGFGDDFLGGPPDGRRPFEHRGLPSTCTFAAGTGVVTCAPETHDGLTISRTFVFKDASSKAQAAKDSTTFSVTSHTDIAGTKTRRDGGKTTVKHVSDQTVTGLAYNSTQRTINGASSGTESSTGTDSAGAFSVARAIGDTTRGIVIPIATGAPTFPTAGTVIRSMTAVVTYTGKTPITSTRREVITYDGSATAKLTITRDGTTKNCTIALPRGRPTCS